jgi:two-component sensor histidine kinase
MFFTHGFYPMSPGLILSLCSQGRFRLLKQKLRILMVEDEAGDAQLAEQVLRQGGFDFAFKRVDSETAFVKELKNFHPSVILSDHGLCAFDGFSALAIAREVHDELGQALTSCKLDASWLAHHWPRTQKEMSEKAEKLSTDIDSTIQTVRRIATELRPGILDHLGLAAALEWQAQEFQSRTGIRCRVSTHLHEPPLDPESTTTFFRIFQETLTNVIRHAEATHVDVHLKENALRVILEVKDDGRGISQEEIADPKSMGLPGMRERAALLGGDFRIHSLRGGKGTRACVAIPRRRRQRRSQAKHEDSFGRRSRRRPAWSQTNSH